MAVYKIHATYTRTQIHKAPAKYLLSALAKAKLKLKM